MKNKSFKLLKYYFQTLWERAGFCWDSDNDNEIAEILKEISEEIAEKIRKEIKYNDR